MKLKLIRLSDNGKSTLGALYIDGISECFILEDEYRVEKLQGETRIPEGTYEIKLRTEGGTHEKYKKHSDPEIKKMHKGMLHLQNVPNFQYILIHIGNTEKDTEGCLLPGLVATFNRYADGEVTSSTAAYKKFYPRVSAELIAGRKVFIEIVDADRKVEGIHSDQTLNLMKKK